MLNAHVYPTDHPYVDKDTCKINLLVFLLCVHYSQIFHRNARTVTASAAHGAGARTAHGELTTSTRGQKSCFSSLYVRAVLRNREIKVKSICCTRSDLSWNRCPVSFRNITWSKWKRRQQPPQAPCITLVTAAFATILPEKTLK